MRIECIGDTVLYNGDCLEVMAGLPENSVDAIVCDPPYHLTSIVKRFASGAPAQFGTDGAYQRASAGFMGQSWDGGDIAFQPATWAAVLRVLKPGGYILAFASTRGFGRMSVAIEDAGFITHPMIAHLLDNSPALIAFMESLSAWQLDAFMRLMDDADVGGMLAWIFGSGFPKATQTKVEDMEGWRYGGQALKPAIEPIYMGQKPFSEKTGTANIKRWGTGAINIDGCRVGMSDADAANINSKHAGMDEETYGRPVGVSLDLSVNPMPLVKASAHASGRWPANLVHDGSDTVLAAFPDSDARGGLDKQNLSESGYEGGWSGGNEKVVRNDSGSAARFFYCAKASRKDREEGLEAHAKLAGGIADHTSGQHITRREDDYTPEPRANIHPTVKPTALMEYLVRLVTPLGGTVLDPFMGSGSTGKAAVFEKAKFIGIEREEKYFDIAAARIKWAAGYREPMPVAAQAQAANDNLPLFRCAA